MVKLPLIGTEIAPPIAIKFSGLVIYRIGVNKTGYITKFKRSIIEVALHSFKMGFVPLICRCYVFLYIRLPFNLIGVFEKYQNILFLYSPYCRYIIFLTKAINNGLGLRTVPVYSG